MPHIRDTVPFAYKLVENATGGPMRVRGVFQRADVRNANGRIYPKGLWEKILDRKEIKENITQRAMIGECDHPSDGEMRIARASHLITKLEMQSDGTVIGEAEILNTPSGQILQELFRANARVGISSRGSGSTVEKNGQEVVQEDFELQTFDFVANPSTPGAHPRVVESRIKAAKEENRMSTQQTFRELREEAARVITQKPSLLTAQDQARLLEQAEDVTIKLNRLIAEDAGYTSLAKELIEKLDTKRKGLTSESAPPPVDRQIRAAALIIKEMVVQLKQRDSKHRAKVVESVRISKAVTAKAKARADEAERRANAASAIGHALMEKVQAHRVERHVEALLAQPKNAHLRPMREQFLRLESVQAVDELVTNITKLTKKQVRESKPLQVSPVAPQTPTVNPMTETASRINKKLGHRY